MGTDVLRSSHRLVLALPGSRGPVVSPMAFWFDGASLWMTTSLSSVKARVLRSAPRCAVWVPPAGDDVRGVLAEGPTRMFSAGDPVGLATHWPAISAAMAALAVKQAGTLGGYVVDLPRLPLRWLPPARVIVRVRIERLRAILPGEPGPGIAPALPGVVPADVRRVLAGRREVVVAAQHDGAVDVRPAVWGAGFSLDLADDPGWPDSASLAAVLDDDPRGRPSDVVGLTVFGSLHDGRLSPERVAWWDGFAIDRADVPSRPAGGIVIPDDGVALTTTCAYRVDAALVESLDARLGPPLDSYVRGWQVWLEPDEDCHATLELRLHPPAGFRMPRGVNPHDLFGDVLQQLADATEPRAEQPLRLGRTSGVLREIWEVLEVFPTFGEDVAVPTLVGAAARRLDRAPDVAGHVDHARMGDEWKSRRGDWSVGAMLLSQLSPVTPDG